MSKHTPGPWRYSKQGDAIVADVPVWEDTEERLLRECEYYGGFLVAESVHPKNKALIMAAPEMYQLLKEQIEAYDNTPMSDLNYAGIDWIKRTREVLAKADGREG